ncbi:hypothetical protein WICPIJ_008430 [Wickerhamomyces pijperi]|uniref:Magnesium transporter n=1 Tax=Wickerhamomyces pijperi TaxID=599730 RepID=A0A9P8PZB9_WICPI|nr:hypothetical protein WICPIJ_008430 [Wickerhamomyces pijperi]
MNGMISNYPSSLLLQKNLLEKSMLDKVQSMDKLRITKFNEHGRLELNSESIKKSNLISEYELFPRDFRKLEKNHIKSSSGGTAITTSDMTPSISVRRNSILINLLNINCLIKSNEMIIFDDLNSTAESNSSHTRSEFLKDLEMRLRVNESDLPYEIKAFESVLISIVKNLNSEMKVITTVTNGIINELEQNISRENLRFLLIQNKKISNFQRKTTLIRDCIDEVLDNDEDLANIYLTDKQAGQQRSIEDHQEIEMLLESYYAHLDEIVQTVTHVISNVKTTEEIINIILDSNRNQLMVLGLRFSIGLLSLGCGMFVASAYGMNLENFIEEDNYGMPLVIGVSTIAIIVLFAYSIKSLKKLEKITMMGDHYKTRKH